MTCKSSTCRCSLCTVAVTVLVSVCRCHSFSFSFRESTVIYNCHDTVLYDWVRNAHTSSKHDVYDMWFTKAQFTCCISIPSISIRISINIKQCHCQYHNTTYWENNNAQCFSILHMYQYVLILFVVSLSVFCDLARLQSRVMSVYTVC